VQAKLRIEQSEADTASFLAAADALASRRDAVEAQLGEVAAFTAQYELTPAEAAALAAGPGGGPGQLQLQQQLDGAAAAEAAGAFFRALERVADIKARSARLLTGKEQLLGLELMDAATRTQVRQQNDACPKGCVSTRSLFFAVFVACRRTRRCCGSSRGRWRGARTARVWRRPVLTTTPPQARTTAHRAGRGPRSRPGCWRRHSRC
jgi:hypothetical protein